MKSGYVIIGNNIFDTLLAISEKEKEQGLMFQKWPPPHMTFVYGAPGINKFWMKNTISPLDIIFCLKGKVRQIHRGIPHSMDIIGDNSLSDLVIELPAGSVEKFKITLGDKVSFPPAHID